MVPEFGAPLLYSPFSTETIIKSPAAGTLDSRVTAITAGRDASPIPAKCLAIDSIMEKYGLPTAFVLGSLKAVACFAAPMDMAQALATDKGPSIMNLLLAIDSSVPSQAVVDEVMARPWPGGTKVCVVSVVESARVLVIPALVQTATRAAQALVGNAADRLASRGLEASASVIQGHAQKDIVDYAEDWGADFVILGSHGHGALERFFLGSTTQAVLRHAACSVEVVRLPTGGKARGAGMAMRVMLATDGSHHSIAAARSIAERPWPEGSEVRVISVVDTSIPAMEPWYVQPEVIDSIQRERSKQAREAISAAEKILSGAGLRTSTHMPVGAPKAAIVDEARLWAADLVVVGAHGIGAIERLLIGSISEAVALHAPCSVGVIRKRSLK